MQKYLSGAGQMSRKKKRQTVCERVYAFDAAKRELWIQFSDKQAFEEEEDELYHLIADSDGGDQVVIYLSAEKAMKRLPPSKTVCIEEGLLNTLTKNFGEKNVKVVEKAIENR